MVRGTTRDSEGGWEIEAAGAEAVIADPDRVGTLLRALAQVTVVVILLGSATGSPAQLEALHGTRLEMLLTKLVDTTVHGVVYESAGSIEPPLLEAGARRVAGVRAQHAGPVSSCSAPIPAPRTCLARGRSAGGRRVLGSRAETAVTL